jgi:hypothetical protein
MPASSRLLPAGAVLVCTTVIGAALASPAFGHHSFAALFDMGSVIEIEGRVTRIHWVNPHIKIYVITTRDEQEWEIEAGPVNLLSRLQIDQSLLNVGDTVRVRGNPARHSARALWVSNILLPDKTELLAVMEAQPHLPWAALGTVGGGTFRRGPIPLPPGEGPSFFRVWSTQFPAFPRPRGAPVLTEAGERAQERYGSGQQAIADCELPGMPFAMMSPYPMEIVQQGDRLLIRGEAYDLTRVIHLAEPASPPAPSPLGVSVGRIEGNELVIETSRIAYHSYGDLGPAQSDQSRVVERFTLSGDGITLDYEITVTDPVMLREPWTWGGAFEWSGAEIRPWNCGVDADGSEALTREEPPSSSSSSWVPIPWPVSAAVVFLFAAAGAWLWRSRAA